MRIGLINIGDELLLGKVLNTNALDLARWIGELGHELVFTLAVGDGIETIASALRDCRGEGTGSLPRCDYLLLTGGLGPTQDDLTREAVAEFLGVPLDYSAEAEHWLAEWLSVKSQIITDGQKRQLYVPRGATALKNPSGTACGFYVDLNGFHIFAFPGVPLEFRAMFDLHCRPGLLRRDAVLLRKRVFTFGLAESRQRELFRGLKFPEGFRFSSLPTESGVALSLEAFVENEKATALEKQLAHFWDDLLLRLPSECIVDKDGMTLTETVFRLLRERNATVSIAESCTAGALGYLITEMPGSSAIFKQGYLTYADDSKNTLLHVSEVTLKMHGAVSEPVALEMVQGCLEGAGSDFAIAITGIAGPDGGTLDKPVGLVYIAVASKKGSEVRRFLFRGDRKTNRWLSAYSALNMLRLFIINELQQ